MIIKNNKFDYLEEYTDNMSIIPCSIEAKVSKTCHDFHALYLKTVKNKSFNFCQMIFLGTKIPS